MNFHRVKHIGYESGYPTLDLLSVQNVKLKTNLCYILQKICFSSSKKVPVRRTGAYRHKKALQIGYVCMYNCFKMKRYDFL